MIISLPFRILEYISIEVLETILEYQNCLYQQLHEIFRPRSSTFQPRYQNQYLSIKSVFTSDSMDTSDRQLCVSARYKSYAEVGTQGRRQGMGGKYALGQILRRPDVLLMNIFHTQVT